MLLKILISIYLFFLTV